MIATDEKITPVQIQVALQQIDNFASERYTHKIQIVGG